MHIKNINHCYQQLLSFCKILQLKMQTAPSIVSGNGCNNYEGSTSLFPVSLTPRNPRHEPRLRDKHACQYRRELLNKDQYAMYRQTDWYPVLDVFRFSASSSSTEVHTYQQAASLS